MSEDARRIINFLNTDFDPFKYPSEIADVSADDGSIIYAYNSDILFLNIEDVNVKEIRAVRALQSFFAIDEDSAIYTSTSVYKNGENTIVVFPLCIGTHKYVSFEGAYDYVESVMTKMKATLGNKLKSWKNHLKWDYDEEWTTGLVRIVLAAPDKKLLISTNDSTCTNEYLDEYITKNVTNTVFNGTTLVNFKDNFKDTCYKDTCGCDCERKHLRNYITSLENWLEYMKDEPQDYNRNFSAGTSIPVSDKTEFLNQNFKELYKKLRIKFATNPAPEDMF